MQHIRQTIEDLRRYISLSGSRDELAEVDSLLAVALEEVRRKIAVNSHEINDMPADSPASARDSH